MKHLTIELIQSDVRKPILPARKRPGDAAFDVYSPVMVLLYPGQQVSIALGFKMELPDGFCAMIIERSGHAKKHGIHSIGPLIDPNYRGEVHAILRNEGPEYVRFEPGDRVAQMLVFPFFDFEPKEGKVSEDTERGASGFGSSGNK